MERYFSSYMPSTVVMTGIAIFAFGVFLAFVVGIGRGGWWLVPMLASSFVSFYLVWSRYPWHSKLSPPDPESA